MKYMALVNYHNDPKMRFTKTTEQALQFIKDKIASTKGGSMDGMPVTTYILEIKVVTGYVERCGTLVGQDLTEGVLGE